MNPPHPFIQPDLWMEAVALCLATNDDQPGYDTASAMAAVDAMLVEDDYDINAVIARLR